MMRGDTFSRYEMACWYVRMPRRTTIEIDDDLLERAKKARPGWTIHDIVEDALRRVAEGEEAATRPAEAQRANLETLGADPDVAVLRSDEMWR
jgi:Arc/MetJ family transcription regulator